MDDPDNPASPFVDKDEMQRVAEEMNEQPGMGTVVMPREEALKLLCQALLAQMREMRDELRAAKAGNYWGDVDKVISAMGDLLPEDD